MTMATLVWSSVVASLYVDIMTMGGWGGAKASWVPVVTATATTKSIYHDLHPFECAFMKRAPTASSNAACFSKDGDER